MLLILCFLSLFAQSFAQVNRAGSCPFIEPQDFEESQILGTWFEYARLPNVFEPDDICINATYYVNDHNRIEMHIDAIIQLSGAWYIWEGELVPTNTRGVYSLQFPRYATLEKISATFISNWDDWGILQLCSEEFDSNQQFVWVWSKHTVLNRRQQHDIKRALEEINMPWELFVRSDQHNCPRDRPIVQLPK